VWAGVDLRALRRDYAVGDEKRSLMYFSAIDPARVHVKPVPGRPLEFILRPERPTLRKAGVFAYWLAAQVFEATRVHLVGFDMEMSPGHFDSTAPSDPSYLGQRRQIREIQDEFHLETWIFLGGAFRPFGSLPQSGVRVHSERDITEGILRPQDIRRKT